MSLVLGLVFLVAALALPLPAGVDGVSFWVGQINLSLVIFNLIPALPLDGGRILRALLWARRRDFLSATRTAGALGRGFGQLLIAGGLALAILGGDFSGIWLVLMGWFVLAAAEAELQGAAARTALAGLTAAHLMVARPVTVSADTSVQAFMDDVFFPTRHTAFPVLDETAAVGIVSFRHALGLPPERWSTTPVRVIMATGPDISIAADAPLAEALPRLTTGDVRRLLVVHDGRLAGLLSETDVLRVLEVRSRLAAPARRGAVPAAARVRQPTVQGRDR